MKNESHAEVVGWPPKKTDKTTIADRNGCEIVSLFGEEQLAAA